LDFFFQIREQQRRQSLKIPYVRSLDCGPLWIAYEAGLFKRNNINAELLTIPGGSTDHPSDHFRRCKNSQYGSSLGGLGLGQKVRSEFGRERRRSGSWKAVVTPGAAIRQTAADLKNKKIGVSRFGLADRYGVRVKRLRHVQAHSPDKDRDDSADHGGEASRFAALHSGRQLTGAMLFGDNWCRPEKMGYHVTIDLSQLPFTTRSTA